MMIIILLVLIAAYALLMFMVRAGKADAFDLHVMQILHLNDDSIKPQKPKILRLMHDTSALGGDTILVILTLLIIGISALTDNYMILLSFAATAISGRLLGYILKKITNRTRPNLRPDSPQMFTTSFPSVHTMMATCLYLWLGFIMPHIMGLSLSMILDFMCIALIGAIAFSRLYLAVHWPSDILGGAMAGLIIILANMLIFA